MDLKQELDHVNAELERLEARKRELYKLSLEAPESQKLCQNHIAEMLSEPDLFPGMKFPVTISDISFSGELLESDKGARSAQGRLVRVRPCDPKLEGKTFLGVSLGSCARTVGCTLNRETGILDIYVARHNPAMWIPKLQRIVFGCESWWSPIETEAQLREITDETINSVWYVQALKALDVQG